MTISRTLLSVLAVVVFNGVTVLADCPVPGAPERELSRSGAVFVGQVVRQEHRKITDQTDEHFGGERLFIILAVDKVWKGDVPHEMVLRTSYINLPDGTRSEMSEDFLFATGNKYLVYASFYRGHWATSGCTRTRNLVGAEGEIEELDKAAGGSTKAPENTRQLAQIQSTQPIPGWQVVGHSERSSYEVSLDTAVSHSGKAGVLIRLIADATTAAKSASIMQTVRADSYREKRVRLSAYLKAENVERAVLWMRMDGDEMRVVNSDHMENRPITGTTDWRRYEIVLDVPAGTRQIIFGARSQGTGQLWVDDFAFEEVGPEIAVTSTRSPAETERGSAETVRKYKAANPELYARQLTAFTERDETASVVPVNMDFEN